MSGELILSKASKTDAHAVWLRLSAFLSLKSSNTQRTYVGIVKEWCDFLKVTPGSIEGARRLSQVSDLDAIAYRKWLENRPGQAPRLKATASKSRAIAEPRRSQRRDGAHGTQANATMAKKLAALRRMYRFLIAADIGVRKNPFETDKVPSPRAQSGQKRPTEMLDFSVVRQVIEQPDSKTPKGLRDRALLSLLFGGGLRRSEVVNLRCGDVRRTQKGTVFVRLRATKSGKDHDQALPVWSAKDINELLKQRLSQGAKSGDFLFISYRGQAGNIPTDKPLSDSGLYKLFKFYCRVAGVAEHVSPHSARATAITKLLASGIPHREVQEFSRHASVQMVEVYDKRRIGVDENAAKELDYE